eukprot:scaffold2643_cov117-Isochrysis_galbana.AAC.12
MVALNVGSVAALTRQFAERMTLQGGGRILLTGFISAAPSGALATTSPVTPWRCRSACPARACPVSPPPLAPAGVPNAALYGATKAFVRSFCAGIRPELRPSGVLVTCLLPGATDTGFAAAAGLESSSVFALPGMRALGMVLPASMMATAALDAAEAGRPEVVPGLLNKGFVLFCADLPLPPSRLASRRSARTRRRRRSSLPRGPWLGCAAAAHPCWGSRPSCCRWRRCWLFWSTCGKMDQPPTRRPAAPPQSISWRSGAKRTLWCSGGPHLPRPRHGLVRGRARSGADTCCKAFAADGCSGVNTFAHGGPRRVFRASISPSALDGQPALVLDYRAAGEPLWGTVAGMRDELRQVMPGVLIGMGGMVVTGGVRNAAPFILVREE